MTSTSGPQMTSSLEVTDLQEDLVRLNLRIKSACSEAFRRCADERQMERANAEARRMLVQFRDGVVRLESLALRQTDPEAREMLLRDCESHGAQAQACQRQFRQANLECILRLQNRDREDLFRAEEVDEEEDGLRRRGGQPADRDSLAREASQATDRLASISRQLASTVARSRETVGELASSSAAAAEAKEEFAGMSAVIGQSRKLINKYARRETTDAVLILFAFAFFFAVVFYVLRKRVLGPLDPVSLAWNAVITLVNTVFGLVGGGELLGEGAAATE